MEYLKILTSEKDACDLKKEIRNALFVNDICTRKIGSGYYGKIIRDILGNSFTYIIDDEMFEFPTVMKKSTPPNNEDTHFLVKIKNNKVYIVSSQNYICTAIALHLMKEWMPEMGNLSIVNFVGHSCCNKFTRKPTALIEEYYGLHEENIYDVATLLYTKRGQDEVKIFDYAFINTFFFYFFCLHKGLQMLDLRFENMIVQNLETEAYFFNVDITNLKYIYFKIDENTFIELQTFGILIKYTDFDFFVYNKDNIVILNEVDNRSKYTIVSGEREVDYYDDKIFVDFFIYAHNYLKERPLKDTIVNDILKSINSDFNETFLKFRPSEMEIIKQNTKSYFAKYIVSNPKKNVKKYVLDYTHIF